MSTGSEVVTVRGMSIWSMRVSSATPASLLMTKPKLPPASWSTTNTTLW
jgi:hypothetical protein